MFLACLAFRGGHSHLCPAFQEPYGNRLFIPCHLSNDGPLSSQHSVLTQPRWRQVQYSVPSVRPCARPCRALTRHSALPTDFVGRFDVKTGHKHPRMGPNSAQNWVPDSPTNWSPCLTFSMQNTISLTLITFRRFVADLGGLQ